LNSIFADYPDDWFIPFVGDDVAKCISNLKKAAIDTQKGANLGLKCVRMRLAAGLRPDPLGELERSPRPPMPQLGRGVPTSKGEGREGMGKGKEVDRKGEVRKGREGSPCMRCHK